MKHPAPITPPPHHPSPIAWTIAGSDSGGGAGIQADLHAMHGLGAHGCSVVTAVTAQNSRCVAKIHSVAPDMIEAQMEALREDLPPAAVKLGMLGNAATAHAVAAGLSKLRAFVVYDPVMAASSGGRLMELQALAAVRSVLLPHVDLLTPNVPEAERLLDRRLASAADMARAAEDLLRTGVKSVLLKGGHLEGGLCQDFWTNGQQSAWLSHTRLHTSCGHGGGCTLSSAIAAGRALGLDELSAVVLAKAYTHQGLRGGGRFGAGRGPVAHLGWPSHPADLPWITDTAEAAAPRLRFPTCGPAPLGLYPIVDRAHWVQRLAALGVATIQLRAKDLQGAELEREVTEAISAARAAGARLFINDAWPLALQHGAYGVHLGQDDLPGADLNALARAGLRLGLSTHTYAEIARAMSVIPSYLAIGTLFESPSKSFAHQPLGLTAFARMQSLVGVPVVAIGGITLERTTEVLAAGADGIAVISDVTKAANVDQRVRDWQVRMAAHRPPPREAP